MIIVHCWTRVKAVIMVWVTWELEALLLDARHHNITDAKNLLQCTDVYVERREIFVTINEPQDSAKRLTNTVGIFEHYFKIRTLYKKYE
jgi:hypothetical protein